VSGLLGNVERARDDAGDDAGEEADERADGEAERPAVGHSEREFAHQS